MKRDMAKAQISVIVPAFNEGEGLRLTQQALDGVLAPLGLPYELVFVNDGSRDDTWAVIESMRAATPNGAVRGVSFSRNFGKESAIFAGLAAARGACAIVIDADLQHPVEKIPEMVRLWQEGYEVVEGIKTSRGEEGGAHRLATSLFYGLISRLSGLDLENTSDFKLLDRKVVDVINAMPERNTFFRALSFWTGFKRTSVSYDVKERQFGETKWSTAKLVRYAVRNIASFSAFPMTLVLILAVILFGVAIVMTLIALIQKFTGRALGGFTTVILLILFSSSIIMGSIGIIGIYIAQIYEEVKQRPRYIVAERFEASSEEER
ncbi:MAG: glycosyltransferase family 2 protein [Peptoniphilaceae bacterium]|nr:glycosyltransferase family 2 protein [Peptoniphilaceae bacterium]